MSEELHRLQEDVSRLQRELRLLDRGRAGGQVQPGRTILGQNTEIRGDLTVSGAIHAGQGLPAHSHTGLIYGFDPPIKIFDGTGITAGTHNIYLPDYGVSGYSWVFVILGGRSDQAGSYMHVRKYGTEEWFVACANPPTNVNVFVSGWCPVASNRIALYASALIAAGYLRITAAKI